MSTEVHPAGWPSSCTDSQPNNITNLTWRAASLFHLYLNKYVNYFMKANGVSLYLSTWIWRSGWTKLRRVRSVLLPVQEYSEQPLNRIIYVGNTHSYFPSLLRAPKMYKARITECLKSVKMGLCILCSMRLEFNIHIVHTRPYTDSSYTHLYR